MLFYLNQTLLYLFVFLLTMTTSLVAEQTTYRLSKDKLKCLYAQIDSLLSEPADLLIVLLSTSCTQPNSSTLLRGEKTELPFPNPTISSEATATLKPENVLVLKKAQLLCFKQQFSQFMQQPEDFINIAFNETCPSGTAHEQYQP
jgi:hypothetical protein